MQAHGAGDGGVPSVAEVLGCEGHCFRDGLAEFEEEVRGDDPGQIAGGVVVHGADEVADEVGDHVEGGGEAPRGLGVGGVVELLEEGGERGTQVDEQEVDEKVRGRIIGLVALLGEEELGRLRGVGLEQGSADVGEGGSASSRGTAGYEITNELG
jgi:hypothetical protein